MAEKLWRAVDENTPRDGSEIMIFNGFLLTPARWGKLGDEEGFIASICGDRMIFKALEWMPVEVWKENSLI